MKKLLFLLVFSIISSNSFSQIIVNKRVVKMGRKLVMVNGEIKREADKVITERIDITQIQDEYIQITLGKRYHYLSTSKHKNIKINAHWKKKYWNVYDEGILIALQDEIDVLNFFSKYGFEYFKQNTKTKGGNTVYIPSANFSTTSIASKSSITLKNNNN